MVTAQVELYRRETMGDIRTKGDINSMTIPELEALMEEMGEKPFRARQIYGWFHQKLVSSVDEMSNIPLPLRQKLALLPMPVLHQDLVQVSKFDGTRKYLFCLDDGNRIESVMMRYHHGNSVCISSQAGCRMGCRFCASTIRGKARDLTAAEMLGQVYQVQSDTGERVSNVVVMGSGEPLENYNALMRFLQILTGNDGLHISQRNITVSTCGLVPEMKRLAGEKLQITLALSLHAPNDEIRRKIMPIAFRYSYEELMEACLYYEKTTGRRMTLEYSLISGVNDRPEHARELAGRIRHLHAHVNLIPVNPVKERDFARSSKRAITDFKNELEKYGNNVTIRREMGADIDGACGQLRNRIEHETGNGIKA